LTHSYERERERVNVVYLKKPKRSSIMMSIHSYVCVAHNLTEERESKCQALWGEYKALLREYPFQRNSSHGEGVREKRGGGGKMAF